jgi:transposase-like protein
MAEREVSTLDIGVRFPSPALVPSGAPAKLSVVKTQERELARRLRREDGASIKEIARRVGVSVSSVSLWVRDVELTGGQEARLRLNNRMYDGQKRGRAVASANRRAERVAAQEDGRRVARRREPLHIAGCMLYWAEGAKARNQLRFSNSDPEMARFFVEFLQTYFDLSPHDIRLTCNLFADHVERQREIEKFWLTALELPPVSLCKSTVNVHSATASGRDSTCSRSARVASSSRGRP